MHKYRLLMRGGNFLLNRDGKQKRYGFYQNVVIVAGSPRQAKLLAISKIWHDRELEKITLNAKDDPPKIQLETLWELDILDDVSKIESNRTFFPDEKKWWQFWKNLPRLRILF